MIEIDKKIKIDKENNKIIVNNIDYPPTFYNIELIKKYFKEKDENILERLSKISLDFLEDVG